jgi:rhamnosyltransferase
MNCVIIVPTLNAALDWPQFAPALLKAVLPEQVLIVDSSSSDGTSELARTAGFRVQTIVREKFNHGGTRQSAVDSNPEADIVVLMTQDAVLVSPDAIQKLIETFADPKVAAAYGRQLPRREAGPIEAHARLFSYPTVSNVRTLESRQELGFKSIFISNAFAAYRRDALMAVGGFPRDVIFGEDTIVAAKLLLAGWKIAYVAEAQVYHSHAYNWRQEFRRYFDIGVLHTRESWLTKEFGQVGGEGGRFVRSELASLWAGRKRYIPSALVRTALKFAGYKLGKNERRLSLSWKRRLSMYKVYWKR